MNFYFDGGTYFADEGYIFRKKDNGITARILCMAKSDNIDNWICEKIPEPEKTEITDYNEGSVTDD